MTNNVNFIKYFATHGRGIDEFIRKELFNLNGTRLGSYVEGKISFESIHKPKELKEKLKTIERLFLSILFLKHDDNSCKYNSIDDLINLVSFKNFDENLLYVDLTEEISGDRDEDEEIPKSVKESKKPRLSFIKYRINCKLTGEWRQNDRKIVRQKLQNKFESEYLNSSRCEIDEINPHFEIILHITNDCIG